MLIRSHQSSYSHSKASSATVPKQTLSAGSLYYGGDWEIHHDDLPFEEYDSSRNQAVELVQEVGKGKATYTIWDRSGDFKTLSPEKKEVRLQEARSAGWKSGLEVAGMAGFVGLLGSLVMGVTGEVGSLFSTMAGGSGTPTGFIGLGVAAAVVGIGGLISGLSAYAGAKNHYQIVARQTGTVQKAKNGFEFHPDKDCQNTTPVLVTKEGVTPLESKKA